MQRLFQPFANGAVTPEYYLNFNSTVAGSSTTKVVQFPINLHVLSLTANTQYTVALWAQNVAGNVANNLQIYLYQFLGTGVTSPAPILITPQITVSNTWTRYVLNTIFPYRLWFRIERAPGMMLIIYK